MESGLLWLRCREQGYCVGIWLVCWLDVGEDEQFSDVRRLFAALVGDNQTLAIESPAIAAEGWVSALGRGVAVVPAQETDDAFGLDVDCWR